MFQELLDEALKKVDGALACSLVGLDGIPVQSRLAANAEMDAATMGTEMAGHIGALLRTAEALQVGPLGELSFCAGRLWAVARVLDQSYFVVLFLRPGGNLGKGRYQLRQLAPRLRQEL